MPRRSPELLLLTPRFGAPSETFIRRHVEDLVPTDRLWTFTRQLDVRGEWDARPPTVLDERRVVASRRQKLASTRLAAMTQGLRVWKPTPSAISTFKAALAQTPKTPVLFEFLDQWTSLAEIAAADGRKVVVHGHGYDVSSRLRSRHWRNRYRSLSEFATLVVMSEYCKQRLMSECSVVGSSIAVIPYGVGIPNTIVTPSRQDALRVVMVGRLVAKKNPIPMLDGIDRAISSGHNIFVDVIGEGPLRPNILDFISRRPNLIEAVTMNGVVPNHEVLKKVANSDVFALNCTTVAATGEEEGLPVAILEAMAAGRAIVSTIHAGVPEAVTNGVNGFLTNEGDTVGFQHAFQELASSHDLVREMGCASRKIAQDRFSWHKEREALRMTLGLPKDSIQVEFRSTELKESNSST